MQFGNPLALTGQTIAFGPAAMTVIGGFASANVTVPVGTRTLVLKFLPASGNITAVSVLGNTSGLYYYGNGGNQPTTHTQAPYLQTPGSPRGYMVVVPISAVVDQSFQVVVALTASACQLEAWADPDSYKENLFYNGSMEQSSASVTNGASTIITGPARLLTAVLDALSPTTSAVNEITYDGLPIARIDLTTGAPAQTVVLAFPDFTILDEGQTLAVQASGTGATAQASVAWAYP